MMFKHLTAEKEGIQMDEQLFINSITPEILEFANDPDFSTSWQKLDMKNLSNEFNAYTAKMPAYNAFHTRERRLWTLKLSRGNIAPDLEEGFRQSIPEGIQAYKDAFEPVANCLSIIEQSGLGNVLSRQSSNFTKFLSDAQHPLTQVVTNHFQQMGCSGAMIDEFNNEFATINYNFIPILADGRFSNVADNLQKGIAAQIEILQYTQENGFSYLRGRCGPPKWAVTVSEILAAVGISISAWWVIVIIAVLVAILIAICSARILPATLQAGCNYLSFTLKFSF